MATEIKGAFKPGSKLDEKRFRLPGIAVKSDCPKCGRKVVKDLGDDYLSFPKVDEPFDIHMWCDECDEEWHVKAILSLSLKLA